MMPTVSHLPHLGRREAGTWKGALHPRELVELGAGHVALGGVARIARNVAPQSSPFVVGHDSSWMFLTKTGCPTRKAQLACTRHMDGRQAWGGGPPDGQRREQVRMRTRQVEVPRSHSPTALVHSQQH
eukprot:scaffold220784_cov32-Tisochrysis_lutea.AAC.2